VLALGPDARMNLPGTGSGNWSWRLLPDQLRDERAEAMRELNTLYGRLTA
jgi:4-alpha-glucanotransferase